MTRVLAQAENELAAFLLLLLPGSLNKREQEAKALQVFKTHRIGGSKNNSSASELCDLRKQLYFLSLYLHLQAWV